MQFSDVGFLNINISIHCYDDFTVGFDETIYDSNAVKISAFYTNSLY